MFQSLLSFLLASTLSLASISADVEVANFDAKVLLNVSPIPIKSVEYVAPGWMSADAITAVDLESQSILYSSNSSVSLPMASLTKLMTAYIIIEENDPSGIVTVSSNAATTIGSSMGLLSGEEISVKNLLYGLLIKSGNDAATALAEYNAGSEFAFAQKMNEYAKNLGMTGTSYTDPTGLSSNNVASARDLALLGSYLAKDSSILEIVKLSEATVSSTNGYIHNLNNTNILLGELGIKGMKTGKTPSAGECLITLAESPDGHEILTVILGSENRFNDTRTLVDWIYRAYNW